MIDQGILQTTTNETNRKIVIETILTIDHKTIYTTDRIMLIIRVRSRDNSRNRNNNY